MCGCVVHFGRGRGPLNLFFNGFHSALTTGQGQSSHRRSTVPDKRSYVHIICTKRPQEKIASTETSISQNFDLQLVFLLRFGHMLLHSRTRSREIG